MNRAQSNRRVPFSRKVLMASTALVAAGALATAPLNAHAENAWVLSQEGGSFDTDTSVSNLTNITQHTDRAYGVGDLDIQAYQTVNILQNDSGSLFIARDNKNDPTQILGALNANGQVMIIDRNGVFFGEGSRVDVNGIIASTGDVDVDAIMNGANVMEFSNFGEGTIELKGEISVADAGLAAFVSPTVKNSGVINAKLGRVAFAAGDKVTLDLYGDQLVEIEASEELESALLENAGTINAEGGVVQMTARAANDAVDNVINMSGVVNASSVTQKGGKIILDGGNSGTVAVSGTVDASGTEGGEVEIDGQNTYLASTSTVDVSSTDKENGQAGSAVMWGRENAIYAGTVDARGKDAFVETSGGNLGVHGEVLVGEGAEWLLDPTNITIVGHSNLDTPETPDLSTTNPYSPADGVGSDDTQDGLGNEDSEFWVWDERINTALNAGADVRIQTNAEGTGEGDILVRDDAVIEKSAGGSSKLTLEAHDDIIIDGTITQTGGLWLDVDLIAGYAGGNPDADIIINNTIDVDAGLSIVNLSATNKIDVNAEVASWLADFDAPTVNLSADVVSSGITGNAVTVNVLNDTAEIQDGVDAGGIGADIYVSAGSFDESVNAYKADQSIYGANAGIAGNDVRGAESIVTPNSPGFYVTGSGVTVDGFEITGATGADGYGVLVDGANDVTVTNNVIHDVSNDGVHIAGADGASVTGNLIYNIDTQGVDSGNGVEALDSSNVTVTENVIHDTKWDGVRLQGVDGATVEGNDIDDVQRVGVYGRDVSDVEITANDIDGAIEFQGINILHGDGVTITDNEVDGTNADGIWVRHSSGVEITGNDVGTDGGAIGEDGIEVYLSAGSVIEGNNVNDTGANGVYVKGSNGTAVWLNTITNTGGAGVLVNPSSAVSVNQNDIDITGSHGIQITGGAGNSVTNNDIGLIGGADNINGDGILIEDSIGAEGTETSVFGNEIENAVLNGIHVKGSSYVGLDENSIYTVGENGIYFDGSSDSFAGENTINGTGAAGVLVNPSSGINVVYNWIDNTGSHGVDVQSSTDVSVNGNYIGTLGGDNNINGDGIHADDVSEFVAKSNTITNTTSTASDIGSGIQILNSSNVQIGGPAAGDGNTIYNTEWDGVRLEFVSETLVEGNDIDDIERTGVYGRDTDFVTVTGNDIDNVGHTGINVLRIKDLTITDNEVDGTGFNGIWARDISSNLLIDGNFVGTDGGSIGLDGIEVFLSPAGVVSNNLVNDTGVNGIHVNNSGGTMVSGNTITNAGLHGILVNPSSEVVVDSNTIDDVAEDGIHITGGSDNIVSNNWIGTEGLEGNIGDDGVDVEGSFDVEVTGNVITETTNHGVHLRPDEEADDDFLGGYSDDAYVANNFISNAGGDGVHAYDSYDLYVYNNDISNIEGNGVFVEEGSETIIEMNRISNVRQNGIFILDELSEGDEEGIEGFDIRDNIIGSAAYDGIKVRGFYAGWIAGNQIGYELSEGLFPTGVGDDGIDVKGGDYISIYDNNIFGAGFYLDGENVSWSGADGIRVKNVGGIEFLPPEVEAFEEDGFGYGFVGADVEIFGNTIAFTQDDGIEVINGNDVHVEGNILGHIGLNSWDADGIRVIDSAHTVVKSNGVADVLDDGIRVDGGFYAGIFDNHVLRVGDDGIEVSNVHYGEEMPLDAVLADVDYPTVGYPVSIEGNEVVLTGDHGIYVHDSGATRIIDNQVSFAGVGKHNVYKAVNGVANDVNDFLNSGPVFTLALVEEIVDDYEPEFTLRWGNGDGIKVENVFRDDYYPFPTDKVLTTLSGNAGGDDSHYFEYGYDGWAVLIQGNQVAYTGGDGIDVNEAGTTLIGGYLADSNSVYQAGIKKTTISGFESFAEWTESGPFMDEEARRVVWIDGEWDADWSSGDYGDLTGALYDYLTDGIVNIKHDTHDGIRATNIYNDYFFRPRIVEAEIEGPIGNAGNAGIAGGFYGYAVNVIGNTIDTTGDDGIEVGWSSSALIKDNYVTGAGVGLYDGSGIISTPEYADERVNYGSGDYFGADGISAHDIYGERGDETGSYAGGDYEEYALVIDGNYVDGTADDGIEAFDAGRTLISNNWVMNNGVFGNGYRDVLDQIDMYDSWGWKRYDATAGDGYGSDGIHVRNVYDHSYNYSYDETIDPETGYLLETYTYTYGADTAVDINNNMIDVTGDDGIEVLDSGRTVIDMNTITHAGYGGGYYYGAADGWGADGIHVRNVIGGGYVETETNVYDIDGYYGYYTYIDSYYDEENLYNVGTSVLITNNIVDVTGDDGIQVLYSGNSVIDNNEVYNAGYGDDAPYEGEGIYDGNGADGIHVMTGFIDSYYGGGDDPKKLAIVSEVSSDYFLSTSTEITNNIVNTADDDGIDVEGVTDVLVASNDVDNVNDDGIEVVGYAGGFGPEIAFGVASVEPTFTVNILGNDVNNSGDTGVTVEGMDFITVSNNDVMNSDEIGVLIAGPNNGSVVLSGNTLTDNDVHARFESGVVDLTGAGNSFNNGRVGIQFDGPLVSLIDNDPDDEFEGTLGAQTFTNQSQYFVELQNGALFEPGQPSIYNALDSSYFFNGGYFTPADTGGIVTAAQLAFLEDMFQHFNDDDTLGLFFFGALSLENLEDFFNTFGTFDGGITGASVTITGLPSTSPQQTALLLNNLTPAAGGEGGIPGDTNGDGELSAEEAAALDPAAGGEDVNCWNDAMSGLEGGATVNYSFDTSFESALADTAGCGVAQAQ